MNRFTEQIDVLDLLINILRQHEEKLDKQVSKLDILVSRLERVDLNRTDKER